MSQYSQEEGWFNESQSSFLVTSALKSKPHSFKIQPNNLISQSYPIEPDMILGWKPKLPIGPVPLTYVNYRSEYVLTKLVDLNFYKLVYLGNRHINSVKVNQQYDYSWKERNKYCLNLKLLKDVIQFVGNNLTNKQKPVINSCQYSFDSNFQSGNLDFVVQTKNDAFDCFVKSDTNTKGHCNWFYFSVTNKDKIGKIKLNICNLTKNANLYRKGMKPYMKKQNQSWKQLQTDISYVQRYCRYGYGTKNYQLQFDVQFTQPNQTIYFSYGIPYTYSKLESFIKQITKDYSHLVSHDKMCESLGGLPLPLLTITDESSSEKKKVVLITGRIHPGQSVSSFVVEGFIRTLLSSHKKLLQRFIFKIVPMMNPDGVVVGNFRTSYSGKDLNRQFNKLNKNIFPEIFYLDQLAKSLKKEFQGKFIYYFDFHGHSTKTNLFCYGPDHGQSSTYYLKCRAFSKVIQQQDNIFSYRKSIFSINPGKKNTGRASMLRKVKIPMTFTFQLSNGLYDNKGTILPLADLEMLRAGVAIVKGFSKYTQYMYESKSKHHMRVKTKLNASKNILSNHNQRISYSSQRLSKRKESLSKVLATNQSKLEANPSSFELLDIYQNILKQQNQMKTIQQQGGSDSQDDSQDFDDEETNLLFKTLCQREIRQQKLLKGNTLKLKNIKTTKNIIKSQKQQKQTSIRQQDQKQTLQINKPSKPILRSLTARMRRPTIPIPPSQYIHIPIQKQVLIQKSFILNL